MSTIGKPLLTCSGFLVQLKQSSGGRPPKFWRFFFLNFFSLPSLPSLPSPLSLLSLPFPSLLTLPKQKWIGGKTPLEWTSLYGIRVYTNNSVLLNHVDRSATHAVSAIIQVDQRVEDDWLLEVIGHDRVGLLIFYFYFLFFIFYFLFLFLFLFYFYFYFHFHFYLYLFICIVSMFAFICILYLYLCLCFFYFLLSFILIFLSFLVRQLKLLPGQMALYESARYNLILIIAYYHLYPQFSLFIESSHSSPFSFLFLTFFFLFLSFCSVVHGRPKPFNGDYFANLFIHYRPKENWNVRAL